MRTGDAHISISEQFWQIKSWTDDQLFTVSVTVILSMPGKHKEISPLPLVGDFARVTIRSHFLYSLSVFYTVY